MSAPRKRRTRARNAIPACAPVVNALPGTCPRCGTAFGCGAATRTCWCTRLAPIDPARLDLLDATARAALGLPADTPLAGCLCPDCLTLVTEALAPQNPLRATETEQT